jgi:hypothetical protein
MVVRLSIILFKVRKKIWLGHIENNKIRHSKLLTKLIEFTKKNTHHDEYGLKHINQLMNSVNITVRLVCILSFIDDNYLYVSVHIRHDVCFFS